MKSNVTIKSIILDTICLLFVLLFVYAAVSKLLDFENFQVQLGQSPLLSAFAKYVAFAVPAIEVIIAILIIFPKYRLIGLFASFSLMILFTTYIYIILNYSSFVPCSCGGILEELGWMEHLIFNIVFVLLALIGIFLLIYPENNRLSRMKPIAFSLIIIGISLSSMGIVLSLYFLSEHIIHKRNNFVRRFPSHAQPEISKVDLQYNSYYFAGIADGKIYLGNTTAPLSVMVIDTTLKTKSQVRIQLDNKDLPYRSVEVRIASPYFYLTDGTVPCIFRGSIKDWKAKQQKGKIFRFTLAEPMDSITMAFRLTIPSAASNILGTYKIVDRIISKVNPHLLQRQIDGIFDTDGMLIYNQQFNRLHYIYYYRNQFITINPQLQLERKGKTIDTVSKAQIKVANLPDGESKMSAPPLVINKAASVYKNLLFINSERIGKYEDKNMLDHASIIDVYDIITGNYLSSLYVYHIDKEKIKSFRVYDNKLFTLTGHYLTVVKLSDKILDAYQEDVPSH
ncbi:hypothetical protein EKL97_13725 [Flavobacterium sp. LS1P28]|uniref:MauE/DoxX family redox-associated membrane protein n=1 Tax=Flavobacterium sp. LS1P28 TaxID=2497752 RepID=UPI000F8298AF|nr:MauE/DoxX family redox-associated membrane protein [Flavobacterium sp. LS1P28]RTY78847.1 hypothetical protein EKL97_13725 [Flavobacterium sp. LS1P28]